MKLIRILSDRIQMQTDEEEFSGLRIQDLITVTDGTVELIACVTSLADRDSETEVLGEEDYVGAAGSVKMIECSIIGSIKNGRYVKAVDRYPTTDIEARGMKKEEFAAMLQVDTEECFPIGQYVDYGCTALVNGNKLFQRHSCIVGNTGCGKSETVAKILEEVSKLPGANIVLFDIHGEYSRLSYVDNLHIGPEFSFPVWMFGFSDMVANILKIKEETSTVAMAALRKCYMEECDGNESKPVYFDYDRLLNGLKFLNAEVIGTGEVYKTGDRAGELKTVKGDYNGKLSGVIHVLEAKRADKRYSFLFGNEKQEYLYEVVDRLLGGDKPVKNIDLSDVPHDVAIPLIGVITKLVYDIQRSMAPAMRPVMLVCDEAHVYIPNHMQLTASERRMVEIFENIAKEGRKFGTTLFVASQRPSELNKTILAQCANFIVSKLNNETDKSMIKAMLPEGNESVVESTVMFSPGDILIVGDAVPVSMKIHVDLARERPQSRTVAFWDEWKKAFRFVDYSGIVDEFLED